MNITVDYSVYEKGSRKPEYTIETDLKGEVSLADFVQHIQSVLVVTANEVLREEQALGFDKDPIIAVDGRVGKPLSSVHPFGVIEITAKSDMKEIVLETYNSLLKRSPVLTGRYKSSHFVFLNGTQVATDLSSLTSWLGTSPNFNDKDLIRFVNVQPYGRKLERLGVTAGRTKTRTVSNKSKKTGVTRSRLLQPNGAYFLTGRAIRAKYKRNSVIKFTFISGDSLGISGSFKQTRRGKPGRRYLYPSIIISVQQEGIA
jgi:hypothetical protein